MQPVCGGSRWHTLPQSAHRSVLLCHLSNKQTSSLIPPVCLSLTPTTSWLGGGEGAALLQQGTLQSEGTFNSQSGERRRLLPLPADLLLAPAQKPVFHNPPSLSLPPSVSPFLPPSVLAHTLLPDSVLARVIVDRVLQMNLSHFKSLNTFRCEQHE